jgi:hypothetical protein
MRACAKAYGIPRSTLHDRLNGSQNYVASHEHQQRLTAAQERILVGWILSEESCGRPPTHPRLREMAGIILRANGDTQPLGKLWVSSFLRRNPDVDTLIGRKLEAARADAATPEAIQEFFERYERLRQYYGIKTANTWNMDEQGSGLGVCTNSTVLGKAGKRKAYVKTPETREWASTLEAISAAGEKLQAAIVFKGRNLLTSWFPAEVPNYIYATSENGWTSNELSLEWLQRIFIPHTQPAPGEYRFLIMDGHGSHATVEFQYKCYCNRIICLYLPAHCSHILQPLDLSCFSAVKTRYRGQIQRLAYLDDAAPVKKARFITYYTQAREEGLSKRNIIAGWRAAGICPYNPEKVLNSSQVLRRLTTPPPPPPPPLPPYSPLNTIFQTPQKPQDMYRSQQILQQAEPLSRSMRTVLNKAAKAIGQKNVSLAKCEALNKRLVSQLDSISSSKPRKRVRLDPNERFADIENIWEAKRQSEAETARRRISAAEQAEENAAAATAAATLESMCNQFQI